MSSYQAIYKKLASVYSGPFCDVYKGESEAGTAVALKVVDLDFIKPPHDIRNEIKLIKSLQHRNIVEFLDTYSMGEDHYLVMPFFDRTLADVMKHFTKRKTRFDLANPLNTKFSSANHLPIDHAGLIVLGLLDAVQYIHERGIIHRDIKPSNVFFESLESLHRPVLGDFGISYNITEPPIDEPSNQKFTDIATGYYKAPELCFAVCDYGTEVDLWALGILISCLYSLDGEPANKLSLLDDCEQSPEINDFVLLQGTFEAFGTPNVVDKNSELYWEKLANPLHRFVDFSFVKHDRRPVEMLLPRCNNTHIVTLFEGLTRYDKRKIIRPGL